MEQFYLIRFININFYETPNKKRLHTWKSLLHNLKGKFLNKWLHSMVNNVSNTKILISNKLILSVNLECHQYQHEKVFGHHVYQGIIREAIVWRNRVLKLDVRMWKSNDTVEDLLCQFWLAHNYGTKISLTFSGHRHHCKAILQRNGNFMSIGIACL